MIKQEEYDFAYDSKLCKGKDCGDALAEAFRFVYDVVYTNTMSAGAYRGYGAAQGCFAVESAVTELAEKMGMDPVKLRTRFLGL